MSRQFPSNRPRALSAALSALELGMLEFSIRHYARDEAKCISERTKLSAKLLARAADIQRSKALEAVAQAVRFRNWHVMSAHLAAAESTGVAALPESWFDALSEVVLLLAAPEAEVAMPAGQVQGFERFGQTLAMLTDAPLQRVMDEVVAGLCGGKTWTDVLARTPLRAAQPLYRFNVPDVAMDSEGDVGGYFEESPACRALVSELDELWQGYDSMPKAKQRKARAWVENALAAQPGFLEGGLALAWMQHEAGQAEASSTADRFVRQAEALIPKAYKAQLRWGHLGNRFFHRLLWLQLKVRHSVGDLAFAAKVGRKMLRLNPQDNLGVRYVLPLLQLEQGEYAAARRSAVKHLDCEHELTAGAIKAFCEFALGDHVLFRRNLATALLSLPWLRLFLLNQSTELPEGDDGSRSTLPDLELFADFAWPAYVAVPGLRKACTAFLAEPLVHRAEAELRTYWYGFWRKGAEGTGTLHGWHDLASRWIDRLDEPSYEEALRLTGRRGPATARRIAPRTKAS